ncbi:MAG: prephenate dehydrogenase/arogenate dehydrogenase family protein [Negativicutes bacterium]|nr:prephenate dehydrogenase/arogenate dehydrogenase family protein [Negativicutes bacterium]
MIIAIIGVGLIGGSLGLALKQGAGEAYRIVGIDSSTAVLDLALNRNAIDEGSTDCRDAAKADIIFLCTPVLQIKGVVERLQPVLRPGTLITDVGSSKEYLLHELRPLIPAGIAYIGGHPMAGREKSGVTAADKDLFRNKWYILTEGIGASPGQFQRLKEVIEVTGARTIAVDAASHDWYAAYVSHIPHVAAAALVNLLRRQPDPEMLTLLIGGGFRDTTRIASSDADMWADICMTNPTAIVQGLTEMRGIIDAVISAIEKGDRSDLYAFFREAKTCRDALLEREAAL